MSPFSLRIREEVLISFPEWAPYVAEETWKNSPPYLVVTVPPPTDADTEQPLRISTWDEEVTVDFDYYHAHFDRWTAKPGDTRHQSALMYVQDLLAERLAVASWWQDSHCKVCAQMQPGGSLKPSINIGYNRIRVRSWNGTHNAESDS
jgi:hypothetical protein